MLWNTSEYNLVMFEEMISITNSHGWKQELSKEFNPTELHPSELLLSGIQDRP